MREEIRSVKFVGAIETGSDYLTKEDKEYLRDMNDLIDRWYSLRLIQSLKDD